MSHSKPSNIELTGKWNKVIKPTGVRNKQFVERDTRGMDDRALRDESAYRGDKPEIDGKVLDKPIQVYRMWYRFLQLALELEEKKVSIIVRKERVRLKTPRKDKWGKLQKFEMRDVLKRVKVNRMKYEGWDIDLIPSTSFDDWWKGSRGGNYPAHRELFYPERSTIILKKKDEWVDNPNFTYVRIDNRRRVNDIVGDLRDLFAEQKRDPKSVSSFPIEGRPNINTLINRYNALILQLTKSGTKGSSDVTDVESTGKRRKHRQNMTDAEMLTSGLFRKTSDRQDVHKDEQELGTLGVYRVGKDSDGIGRVMRDLILPAKLSLLSVCDGYFVNNPFKDYYKD
ncbi:hypothetical protein N9X12_06205 [Alphaproteobacteria bacterium]|nr:hypothetical protein [Alphaproteobacteria bacterium]